MTTWIDEDKENEMPYIDVPSVRLKFNIEPSIEVEGIGTWANTSKPLHYEARAMIVHISEKGKASVRFEGSRAKRNSLEFKSSDRRIQAIAQEGVLRAMEAWRAAQ